MIRQALPLALILLAGCARSEEASNAPLDGNALAVERVRALDQSDQELALGEWRESLQEDFAALEFGPAGAPPIFSLRCDERGGVLLQRHGTPPSGDLPMMLVTIGNDTRRLAVTSAGGTIPMLRATVNPQDQLLQRLGDVAAAITIRIGDSPPLVVPPSPQFGPFIAGCASADRRRSGAVANNSSEANETEPTTNGSTTE